MFAKVLIANRGEIALRIARTCREMGIRTVAVYSTVDRESAVVDFADEAVHIGPAAARRSYLSIPAVVETALQTGADAVHPGYGFLAENPDFAEVCAANGLTFIGPRPESMEQLGDKAVTRAIMREAGLPLLPGSLQTVSGPAEALEIAEGIGYPVIVKAAAGGGGRGMAVVHRRSEMPRAFQLTRATAAAVFGDGRLYVERYLAGARHVEVQVLCDDRGAGIHLGDRDCSVQRRHQKLIEEAPAPGLPDELRAEMGRAAVRGALAAGFTGAGTMEFLVGPDDHFHFMEMNARLQVEHPVTEMVTGIDIVEQQIRLAAGQPLALRQEDVSHRGVSIECRINAEDPARQFRPTPGTLTDVRLPGGPFTRVDTHAFAGWTVTADYDSLIAKVVVWAPDRPAAIARMRRALGEVRVRGDRVHTTAEFLAEVLALPEFAAAQHSTALVEQLLAARTTDHEVLAASA